MPNSVVLPPPKWVLNPDTKMTSVVVLYILSSFSQISVLGTVAFLGWRTLMTICFYWSWTSWSRELLCHSWWRLPSSRQEGKELRKVYRSIFTVQYHWRESDILSWGERDKCFHFLLSKNGDNYIYLMDLL